MGNNRNRRSREVEFQSSDRVENTSETRFTQGNATLVNDFEIVNDIFNRNLGSELTEPSQISNGIEAITQRFSEQNSHKMTQIEQQMNGIFGEILTKNRANRDSSLANDEEDAKNNGSSSSNTENKLLRVSSRSPLSQSGSPEVSNLMPSSRTKRASVRQCDRIESAPDEEVAENNQGNRFQSSEM